jgi:hypothetical protein
MKDVPAWFPALQECELERFAGREAAGERVAVVVLAKGAGEAQVH